jgi:predicted nuclease of predicted toxin-antitoxin system
VVLEWARDNGYVVFTNDLDFGAILAATRAAAPSVIQVRAQDMTPEHLSDLVVRALRQHEAILGRGALITIDEGRLRSRILPLIR